MDGYREAARICKLLTEAGFPTMMAGGCVRDRLFGLEPADYDLATAAPPETVMSFFRKKGNKVVPVGIEHGTVALITPLQQIEITTLRQDVDCDGRHATVRFSTSFEEDALRRDLTINALFEDGDGRIIDHVGGQRDLQQQRLRFVGDAGDRIREDYLRSLRYFRFLGRLGWPVQADQVRAISDNLDGLGGLSAERIHKEMGRTLLTPHAGMALTAMASSGVLGLLFPRLKPERLDAIGQLLARLEKDESALAWFTLMYWGSDPVARKTWDAELTALRFSRRDKRKIIGLVDLFTHLDDPLESLRVLLRLSAADLLPLPRLLAYLKNCEAMMKRPLPQRAERMLNGLLQRPDPPSAQAQLIKLEPARRGEALELVRIYWCLGLCRDKNEVAQLLTNPDYYRIQLKDDRPRAVADSLVERENTTHAIKSSDPEP